MFTRNVVLEVEGLKLVGRFYLPDNRFPYPTVCVCHGIPSGKPPDPNDGGYPLLAERICQQGFAVFIFNFRGTGDSQGNLDLLGWTRDLKAAIDYLCTLSEVDSSNLSLVGFSGGAAVSVCEASNDERVSSVIGCACPAEFDFYMKDNDPLSLIDYFRNIGTIRDRDFPHSASKWISDFRRVSPVEYVAGIAPRSLLLVHGSHDETVNVSHAYKLYAKAGEPKQLVIVAGAGHRLRQDDRAMTTIMDWLKSH